MYILKTIGMIVGSLIALIMVFIGLGGIVSSFKKAKDSKKGAVTELLIACLVEILGVVFLVFAGFYFDILSLDFLKIFSMIFIPMVTAVAAYGCFKNGKILAGVLCAVLLVGIIAGAFIISYNSTKGSDIDAIVAAEQAVREQLKSPSTAKFSTQSKTTITSDGDTWTVEGWVEAQNSFGATVRNNYTVVITFTGKNQYSIDSCTIE